MSLPGVNMSVLQEILVHDGVILPHVLTQVAGLVTSSVSELQMEKKLISINTNSSCLKLDSPLRPT